MWEDCVEKSPKKARPLNGLGRAHFSEGNYDEAIFWHQKSLQIDGMNPKSHFYLANALTNKWYLEEAAIHYSKAIQLYPAYEEAKNNLVSTIRMNIARKTRRIQGSMGQGHVLGNVDES